MRHFPDQGQQRSPLQDELEPDAGSLPVGGSTPAPSKGKGKGGLHVTKGQPRSLTGRPLIYSPLGHHPALTNRDRSLTRDEPDADGGNNPDGGLPQPQHPSHTPHDSQATTSKPIALPSSATVPARPWPLAPLAPGVDATSPQRANKNFEITVAAMLKEAEHRFECRLFVDNAYPTLETQITWSIECWEEVCMETQNYFSLSKAMRGLVSNPPLPLPVQETEHVLR